MSITSGFFNSVNGDRTYDAGQFGEMFDGVITDGIFATIGDSFVVQKGVGNKVIIGSGRAWFNKTWIRNSSAMPFEMPISDLLLDRYDAIVIEVNHEIPVRDGFVTYVSGTPSSNPQFPTLVHTETINQYPLAYVLRKANSTEITAANITNKVGSSECPFVTGLMETINIDELITQWKGEFDDWFADVQDTLSDDVAGNLLNKINAVDAKVDTVDDKVGNLPDLKTSNKTNAVNAINSEHDRVTTVNNKFGNLSSLATSAKNTIVAAINEVVASIKSLNTNKANKTDLNSYVKRNPGNNENGNIPTVFGQRIGQSTLLYRAVNGTKGFNQNSNDINNYSRSLTGSFVIGDNNSSSMDNPSEGGEWMYLFLRDDTGLRGSVIAVRYGTNHIYLRHYFDGAWNTNWITLH